MKNINELIAASPEEYEIFMMPNVKVIGIARQCTFENDSVGLSPHEDFWNEFFAFRSIIDRLPLVIKNSMVCWTGDSPKGSNYYTYMPGVICSADTPVPNGLDYRDLPASYVAKGVYGDERNMTDVYEYLKSLGFTTCYTDLGWNAKLFLGEDEKNSHYNSPCRWLVPCMKINN